eukprot:ANDGO_04926.mRNA.1 hypothetical protein H257_02729
MPQDVLRRRDAQVQAAFQQVKFIQIVARTPHEILVVPFSVAGMQQPLKLFVECRGQFPYDPPLMYVDKPVQHRIIDPTNGTRVAYHDAVRSWNANMNLGAAIINVLRDLSNPAPVLLSQSQNGAMQPLPHTTPASSLLQHSQQPVQPGPQGIASGGSQQNLAAGMYYPMQNGNQQQLPQQQQQSHSMSTPPPPYTAAAAAAAPNGLPRVSSSPGMVGAGNVPSVSPDQQRQRSASTPAKTFSLTLPPKFTEIDEKTDAELAVLAHDDVELQTFIQTLQIVKNAERDRDELEAKVAQLATSNLALEEPLLSGKEKLKTLMEKSAQLEQRVIAQRAEKARLENRFSQSALLAVLAKATNAIENESEDVADKIVSGELPTKTLETDFLKMRMTYHLRKLRLDSANQRVQQPTMTTTPASTPAQFQSQQQAVSNGQWR